jgi:hypothetical protein
MSIIYNWNFNPLESYPTASGQTDVVFNVHWQLYATLESSSYASSIIGTQSIPLFESGSTFIPYNELTKDLVFGWVTASMEASFSGSVEAKYVSLSQSIYNQINPPVLVQQAPWLSGSV